MDWGAFPDTRGHFGRYGGRFVAETLMDALEQLTDAYEHLKQDAVFQAEFDRDLKHYVGRPSPLYYARRWSEQLGGARIYLKREDLNHTGAHKVNNTIGQALLARHMGKTRIIAETGAGQHGVASATIAARLGLECVVYMGAEDIQRQAPNVYRMKLLGAQVVPVTSGSRTLKDALNEAMRDWSRMWIIPSISLVRWPARIRIRCWCATSSPSSGVRPGHRFWRRRDACRMPWWPVSAAARMPSACFIRFWPMRVWPCTVWKPVATGLQADAMPLP